jgi:hypothetical protein
LHARVRVRDPWSRPAGDLALSTIREADTSEPRQPVVKPVPVSARLKHDCKQLL